ncbi:hypothetical protein [Mucilaginibacter sp.]|uniref:hypothetical protein n=1 Tax=Mucilaginibacter sp. TaxID=1882438 RepID=UPI002630ED30|nr:hypothetical protein [Mucilaginibacter sp.]
MKKIMLAPLFILLTTAVFAQKYIPIIKPGTVMSYTAYLRNLGQHVPITLTIKSIGDPTNVQWNVDGLGTGIFSISAKAQDSGTKLAVRTPNADNVTKLKDDETFVTVSKTTYTSMIKNEPFELNGIKFTVDTNDTTVYKINNKIAPVLHAISANKKSELWVLNNPDFPLLCGELSIAKGIDLTLLAIKE